MSIIIPCLNESGNIKRFDNELIPYLREFPFFIEIILVDDGSTDDTHDEMVLFQKKYPSIKICQHPDNRGLGAALQTGFKAATGQIITTLDSDLTFHPEEIKKLVQAMTPDVSCVMGSPLLGRFQGVNIFRRILSQGVNICYQILLGKNFTSTSSIFRLYRLNDLKEISLRSTSFDINAEILAKLILKGKIVSEIPVTLASRQWGASKIKVIREIKNHILMFLRIMYWRVRGV